MKFIRSHIIIFLVIIMSILCLCAAGVAINITRIIIERRDQVVKVVPAGQADVNKDKGNIINISRLKEQEVIFNGMKIKGLNAYSNVKDNWLVPLDSILNQQGSAFKYYNSDNILEWMYKSTKINVQLGEDGFWFGKNKIDLASPVTAGKNHILVHVDLFTNLDGYTLDKTLGSNTIFLNYCPNYAKMLSNIKLLTQNNGTLAITDLLNKKTFWEPKGGAPSEVSVEPSYSGSEYLLKSGEAVYLLDERNSAKPYKIPVNPSANWSIDGRFLYWIDAGNKMSYIYDIENRVTRKLGDYYSRINPDNYSNTLNNADILFDYKKGRRFERISFTNQSQDGNYTFIKRNDKIVVEGNLIYSPDKQSVVYYEKGEGYYFAYSDGTKKTFIGEGKDIRWINNNEFIINKDNQNYIVTDNGKTITPTNSDYRLLGKTQKGELIFSRDGVLFSEVDGDQKEIRKLPWQCSEIYANAASGPIIAVTEKGQGIYYIDKETVIRLGTYKAPVQIPDNQKVKVLENLDFSYSPDGKYISFYQEENGFLYLTLFNTQDYELKKLGLNFTVESKTGFNMFSTKWISNSLLLVFSDSKWCAADISGDIKIFTRSETEDTPLYSILSR